MDWSFTFEGKIDVASFSEGIRFIDSFVVQFLIAFVATILVDKLQNK